MSFIDRIVSKIKGYVYDEIPAELMEEPEFPEESDVIIPQENSGEEPADTSDDGKTNSDAVNVVKTFDREIPKDSEMSFEEYTTLFRKRFRGHFPEALDTVESHMQLPFMIGSAMDISPVIKYAETSVYSRFASEPEKLSELSRAAVAKVAVELEKFIGENPSEYFCIPCSEANSESLEKAWIVLDFYCSMLKPEAVQNITKLYRFITNELIEIDINTPKA